MTNKNQTETFSKERRDRIAKIHGAIERNI